MKLTITNETHFSTRVLRAVVTAVARHVAKSEGRALDRLRVRVAYARTWGQAHGALGYGWMALFFRKSHEMTWQDNHWVRPPGHPEPLIQHVADTVRHELMHNYGYHHSLRSKSGRAIGWFADVAVPSEVTAPLIARYGQTVPVHVPPARPKVDVVAVRAARALAGLERWERRLRHASVMVRTYRRRVRYYQKRPALSTETAA